MARFYHLELQADLFGGITLVRRWGRIGGLGQQRQSWFSTLPDAEATRSAWLRRKLARGYLTVSVRYRRSDGAMECLLDVHYR